MARQPDDGQLLRQQAPGGLGASQEDQGSSWSSSRLGCPSSWPAHQDHWTSWPHCRCLKEEINILLQYLSEFVASTPRPLDVVAALSVSQRRNKHFIAISVVFAKKNKNKTEGRLVDP